MTGPGPDGPGPTDEAPDPHRAPALSVGDSPRNRLADEMRRLTALTVGRPLPDDELARAAEEVGQLTDRLVAVAGPGKAPRGMPDFRGHPQDYFPTSPMFGYANPVAPPVEVWVEQAGDGTPELRGRVTFGYQYEGPPTCVHGGVIAELFDEMLGAVNIVAGRAGFTGTLTIVYRRPTPLLVPLDVVARQVRVAGRKIFAQGSIAHDGQVTAEAEGVFIEVRPAAITDIVNTNADQAGGAVLDPVLQSFVRQGGEILAAEGTLPRRPGGSGAGPER